MKFENDKLVEKMMQKCDGVSNKIRELVILHHRIVRNCKSVGRVPPPEPKKIDELSRKLNKMYDEMNRLEHKRFTRPTNLNTLKQNEMR